MPSVMTVQRTKPTWGFSAVQVEQLDEESDK